MRCAWFFMYCMFYCIVLYCIAKINMKMTEVMIECRLKFIICVLLKEELLQGRMHVNLTETMPLHYNMILFCNLAFEDNIVFLGPSIDMTSIH